MTLLLFITFLLIFNSETADAQETIPKITLTVTKTPDVVTISGQQMAYYELYIDNNGTDTISLTKLDILDDKNVAVYSVSGNELKTRYSRPGIIQRAKTTKLPAGASGILYLEFPLQKSVKGLVHRLSVETKGKTQIIKSSETRLKATTPLVLGPPLKNGPWAAVYHPSWENGHRRVFYTVDGKARIPGRFAIDFILLDDKGSYAKGDENDVKNWLGYGANVLAVANGKVVAIRDDFHESALVDKHPDHLGEKATGNYIALDIGNSHIVFYEHLKPGSIKVVPGQHIKKGEIIAALGFTGQTTGPHLHFHVADTNSPLGAEGIPFVFESFTMLGSYPDLSKLGKEVWVSEKEKPVSKEHPSPNSVILFGKSY